MRRWTLLLIPHDTEQPRSLAVSGRMMRWMIGAGAVVVLLAAVGIGSIAWWAANGRLASAREQRMASGGEVADTTLAEMDSLRATVRALHGALDTIRQADARLSMAAGVAVPDSATLQTQAALRHSRAAADSLLRSASFVATRIGAMADSASRRRRPSEDRRPSPPSSSPRSSPQ